MYARTHACMRTRTRARLHTYIRAYPHKRAESMHTIADTPAHGPPCCLRRRLQPCATAEACAPIPTRRTDHDHAGRESAAAMPRRRSRAVSCATGAGGAHMIVPPPRKITRTARAQLRLAARVVAGQDPALHAVRRLSLREPTRLPGRERGGKGPRRL